MNGKTEKERRNGLRNPSKWKLKIESKSKLRKQRSSKKI